MYQHCAAVLCVLAVLGLEVAALGECELARLLQDKLRYEMRLQYMKHNFPIDYTLRVQHEEVLRTANVTRLRDGKVSEASLRYLWFHACSQAVLHILEVLPEKHPSRGYTQELSQLLDALGMEYSGYRQVGLPHYGGDGVGRGMWVDLTPHSPAVRVTPDVGPWGSAGGELHIWHWWFSGRILACHAGGPGSIPGQCNVVNLLHPF
ncbi:interleukin-34, partial [Meleagris gallopavo]